MVGFSDVTRDWFLDRFGEPTPVQRLAWPAILAGRSTLVAAPTGSGKTLAAFLASIDQLFQQSANATLVEGIQTVYVSPLKALSNDIQRNLSGPLTEIALRAHANGRPLPEIRTALRTGDTPAADRQAMLRRPPHILVTTPESLYLLLTSAKARESLRGTRTVIVDEIHALARDKRGSHLALTLERLDAFVGRETIRIGLSATQKPLERIARFLVGSDRPDPEIVDIGHVRRMDLDIEVPPTLLGAVCTQEHWRQIHDRLEQLIESHRSTLIFVNTRRMAERLNFALSERLGRDRVTSHHGSLSRETRLEAEERLKRGQLKAVIATASLELGIDVGEVDLVCQMGSPRSIATFLQRIGRSGHGIRAIPKGKLFALTRDELLEAIAVVRSAREHVLDAVEIPTSPMDILTQQMVAAVAADDWQEEDLYHLVRRAQPYANLTRADFESLLELLADSVRGFERGARIHRDRLTGTLRASRGARLIALSCGGAIPDNADYRVVDEGTGAFVGTVNEDFAIDSMAGDVFLLGNTSWRIIGLRGMDLLVHDAGGAPPSIPFWTGEAPGRTIELSHEVSRLRQDVADRISIDALADLTLAKDFLRNQLQVSADVAEQAACYVAAQKGAIGLVPLKDRIVFERFFDDTGGMQLVVHAPLGVRINRAWGLALRKRFCRSFNFELQASADDNGLVLSLGPQHSFPIDHLFTLLTPENARHMLEQAILDSPLFRIRWRWNVSRALLMLRQRAGKRVPPPLQRFRADDLLTRVFPDSTACLENRPEDVDIPDHPMVRQTMHDCFVEATDFDRWVGILGEIVAGSIELIARDTTEPSPFSHERLNAMPYAFLDDAPLEERRARAVTLSRTLRLESASDLTTLPPEVIAEVIEEAWPQPRNDEELVDLLSEWGIIPASILRRQPDWVESIGRLVDQGRVVRGSLDGEEIVVAKVYWPTIRSAFPSLAETLVIELPAHLDEPVSKQDAWVQIVRGWMGVLGPQTPASLARLLHTDLSTAAYTLGLLEIAGDVLRGRFEASAAEDQWCDRRLLARMHRLRMKEVRRRIQPVEPHVYLRMLLADHAPASPAQEHGLVGALRRLAGFEAPAASWEQELLPLRLPGYDPVWLDRATLSGEIAWGRLRAPQSTGDDRRRSASLTRVIPISLFPRGDVAWLGLDDGRPAAGEPLHGDARHVWELLSQRGALFAEDLASLAGLLSAQLDQALSELAARGLVTADGFAGVRSLIASVKSTSRRRRSAPRNSGRSAGRWSTFPPGYASTLTPQERAERWAELLLDRYSIVFRDLLTRESAAPPWWQIVGVYRRWEVLGKVHGGRFVRHVAGEQYARPGTVDRLRQVRDLPSADTWTVVSAADPLNLVGVVTEDDKIPSLHSNALALQNGRLVGFRLGKEVTLLDTPPGIDRHALERDLRLQGSSRRTRGVETAKFAP
jgi:ATP-dependent Lhr-like helicase